MQLVIKLNEDKDLVDEINQQLKNKNHICPCALILSSASDEEKKKFKCMCESFRNKKTEGFCDCGKYYKQYE